MATSLRGGARHGATLAINPGPPRPVSLWLELAFALLVALVTAFVLKVFVIQSFYIPSVSMENSLLVDDRVTVTKLSPGLFDVHRGDIVVFHDPDGWSSDQLPLPQERGFASWLHGVAQSLGLAPESADDFIIKRVIGLPGDTVACAGPGEPVTVNGQPLDETYLKPGVDPSAIAFRVTVPEDGLWVMGDNRSSSWDSRYHQDQVLGGAVPLDNVVGVAKWRLWPLDRIGVLKNPSAVFKDVPAP
ncbi:MAG: signal peptidase I [Bifidobacteriaceae bacterium]|jgi:signal peptidase I|nr:signal peptidase I [Bifidobacteriaceae bacterium]